MYDKISAITGIKWKGFNMRVKVVCFNCGRTSVDNKNKCEVCNNLFTKVGFIDGIKLDYMNREQKDKWIKNKLGHPLNKEEVAKREEYCKKRMQEFEQQKKPNIKPHNK